MVEVFAGMTFLMLWRANTLGGKLLRWEGVSSVKEKRDKNQKCHSQNQIEFDDVALNTYP